jgi:hypothetical protein
MNVTTGKLFGVGQNGGGGQVPESPEGKEVHRQLERLRLALGKGKGRVAIRKAMVTAACKEDRIWGRIKGGRSRRTGERLKSVGSIPVKEMAVDLTNRGARNRKRQKENRVQRRRTAK